MIQGLPTWYEIRVNKDGGYTARALDYDLMDGDEFLQNLCPRDVSEVRSGGWLLYDSTVAARRVARTR